ncbi:MAG: YggS family pyridoxal phosphate-dependent enzyme [Candidatus Cloacimonetes bacterium]|nr:YggS family pyridoxal phosphate-dependent enzyme [Candidatus Cloacimonadota bacterium]
MNEYQQRIEKIQKRVHNTALRYGRNPDTIKLVTITKTQPVAVIKEAIAGGVEFIGENKVQEAERKIPELQGIYREFHFIGHIQSNKINKLLPLKPDLIHSIDSVELATKINQRLPKERIQNILIQVNTSGETSKYGCEPEQTEAIIRQILLLEHINVCGLMTIGKITRDSEAIKENFALLRNLLEKINNTLGTTMRELSMGMSSDFELAISEGATILRIGTAIMGSRRQE